MSVSRNWKIFIGIAALMVLASAVVLVPKIAPSGSSTSLADNQAKHSIKVFRSPT